MEAGRALDIEVERKVMGRTIGPENILHHGPSYFDPPAYSTEIAAAWEIVEKLRGEGFIVRVGGIPEYWSCVIEHPSGDSRVGVARSEKSAAHDICLAALKAVGG